jgi:PhzF family phenazine biosynthesis protein
MFLPLFQVDAFTDRLFAGNYAAVVLLPQWLDDELLQQIATENNLSETAFIVAQPGAGHFHIRWFSPLTEIDFCGHATLAAAYVLFNHAAESEFHPAAMPAQLVFDTGKVGTLWVQQTEDGWIQMDFPRREPRTVHAVPTALLEGLKMAPREVLHSDQAWFAVYDDAATVTALQPDFSLLKQLAPYDVVATAAMPIDSASHIDFVSRYFWPANGGDEDPVTGSIHAGLTPYWAAKLGKTTLWAQQCSARGGELRCELQGERVLVSGQAVLYMAGEIFI